MSENPSPQSLLKGNFKAQKDVFLAESDSVDVTEEFERRAMAKLGGSICFVRKKSFVLDPEKDNTDA